MKGYDFNWLDCLERDEVQAFAKVVSIFLRGMTAEDLAALELDETDCTDCE